MNAHLGLNRGKVFRYLRRMAKSLPSMNGRPIDTRLDEGLPIGSASVKNFEDDTSHIRVGVAGLSGKLRLPFAPVDDLAFTTAVVCLYHEYGHYLQNYGPDKDILCMISEVSVIGNPEYYIHAWKTLPHEIKAEGMGISMAWDAMEAAFSGKADVCMLDYVNHRARDTAYMIPAKPDGYRSRGDVMAAFEKAMDESLNLPREPLGNFLRYKDESVRLVTQDNFNFAASPNYYQADKLIDRMSGAQKDRMMAALVLELHPDVLEERPLLKLEDLTVEHEFGQSLAVKVLPGVQKPKQDERIVRALEWAARAGEAGRSGDFKFEI